MESVSWWIFVGKKNGQLKFCLNNKRWYEWNVHYWKQTEKSFAFQFARALVYDLSKQLPAGDQKKMRRMMFSSAVVTGAQKDLAFETALNEWDQDPFVLGSPGGVVDLRTGYFTKVDQKT